jgi:transcriptional regulator with XRE-family HTH domain
VAQRLRDWRKTRGLALKEVAQEFGISEATWARWENASRFPSPEFIALLSEYMKIPVCDFFYPDDRECLERQSRLTGEELTAKQPRS